MNNINRQAGAPRTVHCVVRAGRAGGHPPFGRFLVLTHQGVIQDKRWFRTLYCELGASSCKVAYIFMQGAEPDPGPSSVHGVLQKNVAQKQHPAYNALMDEGSEKNRRRSSGSRTGNMKKIIPSLLLLFASFSFGCTYEYAVAAGKCENEDEKVNECRAAMVISCMARTSGTSVDMDSAFKFCAPFMLINFDMMCQKADDC